MPTIQRPQRLRTQVIKPLPPRQPETPRRAPSAPPERAAYRADIALAHASILLYGVGILIALVIWGARRDESRRVAFHALQAAAWQGLFVVVTLLVERVTNAIFLVGLIGDLASGGAGGSTAALVCARAITLLAAGPLVGLGLYAALIGWQGHDFRYPLVGGWIERQVMPE